MTDATDLIPDQILASKQRLLDEGFTAGSCAVMVHDRLLEMTRHTDLASLSMGELIGEIEALRHDIERALASNTELATENEKHQWQPITTAPRDGVTIIVCAKRADGSRCVGVTKWKMISKNFGDGWDFGYGYDGIITHWMPIPQPPCTDESK